MKKILAPSLVAIAAIDKLATSFATVGAAETSNCPFQENLTENQWELLQEKKEEMREAKRDLRGLPIEERHEKMQELRGEFEDWTEENGMEIPMGKGPIGKGFRKGGRGQFKGDCPLAE